MGCSPLFRGWTGQALQRLARFGAAEQAVRRMGSETHRSDRSLRAQEGAAESRVAAQLLRAATRGAVGRCAALMPGRAQRLQAVQS